MIICSRCKKENQTHYKFCLGCGAELPKNTSQAPKPFTGLTPAAGLRRRSIPAEVGLNTEKPSALSAHQESRQDLAEVPKHAKRTSNNTCPTCGSQVLSRDQFCGHCGHAMARPSSQNQVTMSSRPIRQPGRCVVAILPDGSEGERFAFSDSTVLGRQSDRMFLADEYLSPKHARFFIRDGRVEIIDEDSLNGVFLRVNPDKPAVLKDKDIFRIGQEIIRYEHIPPKREDAQSVIQMGSPRLDYLGRIVLMTGRTSSGNAYPIHEKGMQLGRDRGDIIFPDDGYVSGLHCRLHREEDALLLSDLNSSNGTFIKIRSATTLINGDILLMGQQLYRVDV